MEKKNQNGKQKKRSAGSILLPVLIVIAMLAAAIFATRVFLTILFVLAALAAAYFVDICFYRRADETARGVIASPSAHVTVVQKKKTTAFVPEGEAKAGIVFYPGAKISAAAYAPLADGLAAGGYLCILADMPFHIAHFKPNIALSVIEDWPGVRDWYVAGHSLGAFAAEKCAYDNPAAFRGLVNLACYFRFDFSDSPLPVLAVYGTRDGLCSREKAAGRKIPMPQKLTEVIIEGGCHGYYGNYGHQNFDGTPTITREEQQRQTVDAILDFLEAAP